MNYWCFFKAILSNNIFIIKAFFLVSLGTPILYQLTNAIESDDVDTIRHLLNEYHYVTVNHQLSFGVPILLKAVRSQATRVINHLLAEGANPESSISYLMQSLDYNISMNRFSLSDEWSEGMLLKLLSYMSDDKINSPDAVGKSLLLRSCYIFKLTVFEYLLDRGAQLNGHDFEILASLIDLHDCTEATRTYLTMSILGHQDFSMDIEGMPGFYLLCKSLFLNKIELFQIFIENGANPHLTLGGNTLLHFPTFTFLEFQSRGSGTTELYKLYHTGGDVGAERILLLYDLGLDVNAVNDKGNKPLEKRKHNSWDLLILILLGRSMSDVDFAELKDSFGESFASLIVSLVTKGKLTPTNLQNCCRRAIRKSFTMRDRNEIGKMIASLPLPNPLKLYLDVSSYAKHLVLQSSKAVDSRAVYSTNLGYVQ